MAKHIPAPLPGIFFRKPSPDEAPFKQEGDTVAVGETVGLVEAMKSFFPVEADASGTLLRFLVEDGEAVDADQAIVELE
ncbi:acetyl-CoA carboxylase [Mesorhizobium sp. B4-1-1]|uniref:acetyl-CoA carboxylase n=1 Tax=Mesorhizobium sp. B4-1-1 TaxID=2589890 RepID=UPI00112A8864|nr:acetyl-CoA carboxylase [Mesorhizobium sp. B4-1-1]TPI13855.1 biotin carboxyl carrier domain-containing protein [Mesorhizobium sp. B4-1-1]